ncbi:MAG: ParB N-terminal domain-containing protein [Rhodobacteraceae bacterium]|nr:ParB N-terminal domain-containing protein [Paracoccaceae bacterium]
MIKEIQRLTRARTQWVKLTEINTRPDDFQHRATVCNEFHADELARALKSKQELPPVDVWRNPETRELIIIDGHHRLEAHTRASRQKIRAVIYEGPERDAVLYALKANSETKLPMASWERSDAAWRLVCKTKNGEDDGPSA